MKKPVRVGFDLDGVLLYNPARVARYPVKYVKRMLGKQSNRFYIPHTWWDKILFHLFHLSSIFIAPGFDDIVRLTREGTIEPYLITARFSFLENDLKRWLNRMPDVDIFKEVHFNKHDQQPPVYKKHMIENLNLEYFVEDNFDIVSILKDHTSAKVFWIYNILDKNLEHTYKFSSLKSAVSFLEEDIHTAA